MAPPGVKVLLVRHAQSQNNIVQASVQAKIKGGTAPHLAQVRPLQPILCRRACSEFDSSARMR